MKIIFDVKLFYYDQRRELKILSGFFIASLVILMFSKSFLDFFIFFALTIVWIVYIYVRFYDKIRRVQRGDIVIKAPFRMDIEGYETRTNLPCIDKFYRLINNFEKFNPDHEGDIGKMEARYGNKFKEELNDFFKSLEPYEKMKILRLYGRYIYDI